MIPSQTLSKKLAVPSLKDGEAVTFRLLNAGIKEVGRESPTCPRIWSMEGKHDVTDPFDEGGNTRKTIGNVQGQVQVTENGRPKLDGNGMPVMAQRIERVVFEKGEVTVTDNITYAYLMRRKDNLSNRFRNVMGGKKITPRFKLVDDKVELNNQIQIKEFQWRAESIIREANSTEVKSIALKLSKSPDDRLHIKNYVPGVSEEIPAIKNELINKARLFPKQVIQASSNAEYKLRVQLYEAMNFQFLFYDDAGQYFLNNSKNKVVAVHQVKPGEEPMDSLVEFLTKEKEGKEIYGEIFQILDKILNGK